MIFIPRKPQIKMIYHALRYSACAIWASMGIGKTSAMLYVIAGILLIFEGPVLIVAPKKVARKTWPDEFEKFEDFQHISVVNFAKGDLRYRQKLLRDPALFDTEVFIINYDNIKWFEEHITTDFTFLVIDEATRIKSFRLRKGSKRAKSLLKLRKRSQRVVELTGTPAPNGIMDLWGQIYILDFGKRLGRTLSAFRDRWFTSRFLPTHVQYTPIDNAVQGVSEQLKDICLAIRSEDYFDLEEVIETDVKVGLSDKAWKVYKDLEKEMYAKLESGADIDAVNAADVTSKCLQCTSGALYTDDKCKEWEEIHTEKLDALESIVEESGGSPIIVCYHFRHEVPRILKRFPQCVRLTNDDSLIDKWNEGKIPMLLLHPASAGHGLNMQYGGNIIVYYTQWWDFEQDAQVLERIGPMRQMQAGFKRNVFRYNIIVDGSIDLRVKMAREYKLSVNEALKKEAS